MKTIGLIPFWFNNGNSRDIKKLAGKHLIDYSVSLLNASTLIEETIIYSSYQDILNYIDPELKVTHLSRDSSLDNEDILIEDIIESFFADYTAETLVLLHPYSPFLTLDTLNECIKKVQTNVYDSAFTAIETKKFAWYKDNPLNFDRTKKSPKLKDLDSIISEQGLLYVLTKESFLQHKSRVGNNPYMHIINHFEGHEINEKKDFEIAELIINSGMFQGI
ncbi:MAG: HAD family hydrolase [uncultured Sulfurovum sp.]|uniref:HAD family hydrolase n=1 Tax=uncultured Sulfurovum sp. TaxID=269237 RepID=A0A6S6TSZ4_9BACT|nr:MAG: HAD family hydrolase [uncultured Sulfurovum sp.]